MTPVLVPFPGGRSLYLPIVLQAVPETLVESSLPGMTVQQYLEAVDEWARGPGLIYDVVVDFKAGRVTRRNIDAEQRRPRGAAER